jgi:hypothetical protein
MAFGILLLYAAVLELSCTEAVTTVAAAGLKKLLVKSPALGAGKLTTIGLVPAWADSRVRRSATALEVCLIGV